MLMLSRKIGERIVIGAPGREAVVEVVDVVGGRVRLGITAATDIPVHRSEVWERIRRAAEHAETEVQI